MNITSLMLSLGIHSTLKGFHYLKYGLGLCMENEDYLCENAFHNLQKFCLYVL